MCLICVNCCSNFIHSMSPWHIKVDSILYGCPVSGQVRKTLCFFWYSSAITRFMSRFSIYGKKTMEHWAKMAIIIESKMFGWGIDVVQLSGDQNDFNIHIELALWLKLAVFSLGNRLTVNIWYELNGNEAYTTCSVHQLPEGVCGGNRKRSHTYQLESF